MVNLPYDLALRSPYDLALREPYELALRAGPPKPQPPLIVSLLIVAVGIAAPIVFVRDAVPSLFLTIGAFLPPIAGAIALYGTIDSYRRYQDDRGTRMRASVGPDGVTLYRRLNTPPERYPWGEIASAALLPGTLMLQLRGEGGKLTRCALRFSGLETPVEIIQEKLNAGLKTAVIEQNQ
jgi:hypothetical protein